MTTLSHPSILRDNDNTLSPSSYPPPPQIPPPLKPSFEIDQECLVTCSCCNGDRIVQKYGKCPLCEGEGVV